MNSNQISKILELQLKNVNEITNYYIEMLYNKIKRLEFQKQNLLNEKIYWFQIRKKKYFSSKINKIDEEIYNCIKKIEEEIQSITSK